MMCVATLLGCDKWTDVSPKTQIEDSRMFADEMGFIETLNGVYLQMGQPQTYGRELTYGLTDVLGGMYVLSTINGSQVYRDAFAGLYTNAGPQTIINNVWSSQYTSIANVNKLCAALESADPAIFKGNNRDIMLGEALGLRAFLHFDLLRLFGKSTLDGGAEARGIPYVTSYSTVVNPFVKGAEVLQKVKADLNRAEVLLTGKDPMILGSTNTVPAGLDGRQLRFNYYAVKAVKARVALWEGDKTVALKQAEDIIAASPTRFPFVSQTSWANATEGSKNRALTTEYVFGLYVNNIVVNYNLLLDTGRNSSGTVLQNNLVVDATRITQQYESAYSSIDYRSVYSIRSATQLPSGLVKTFFAKLFQAPGGDAAFTRRMPLIRSAEMYYIAAECLAETDPVKAIGYLNIVRSARGISAPLSPSLNATQINDEVRKEYWKDLPLEGQMYFYYKRKNSVSIPGITAAYSPARYVLPIPNTEIEFGNP